MESGARMPASDILTQILNFIAPAFWMACFLVLASGVLPQGHGASWPWPLAWLALLMIGIATLLLGLWLTGRDGKMVTYVALVLTCGTVQWLLVRGWRA